jgi:hypothetical protein
VVGLGGGEGVGDFTVGEDILFTGRDGRGGARVVTVLLIRTESRVGRIMI